MSSTHPQKPAEPAVTDEMVEAALDAWNGGFTGWRDMSPELARQYRANMSAALSAAQAVGGWRPIETAPKDGTPVLLGLKPRPDDKRGWDYAAHAFVGRHSGVTSSNFDMGWGFAAPVGYGGIADLDLFGWMPLPTPPSPEGE